MPPGDASSTGAGEEAVHRERARKVELVTSRLLRVGVVASLVVVVAGIVLSFVQNPSYLSSSERLGGLIGPGASFPHTIPAVLQGLGQGQGQAVVMAGLFLLIATPVLRVGGLILAFAYQRDRVFVAITTVVLGLLLASFLVGRAGG
ncbi:MAG: DUF1634 domain-containing protein [Actinomycetota bacterium]|nr:DUF1634 domain-containing protein [Actinomycetota bacterium]